MEATLGEFSSMTLVKRTPAVVAGLDIQFHDAMFLAAHNVRLYRAWEGLRSQLYSFLHTRMTVRVDYQEVWVADHQKLLDLVRTRQRNESIKAISKHIDRAYRRLVDAIDEDATALRNVKPLDELGDGALARPGWSHNPDDLPSGHLEIDIV